MSGYRMHLAFYTVIALPLSCLLHPIFELADSGPAFLLGALYSVLADMDSRSSKIRHMVCATSIFVSIALILVSWLTLYDSPMLFSAFILFFLLALYGLRHRGRMHSLTFAVIFSAPTYLLGAHYAFFAFCGYISHLLLDRTFRI